MVKVISISDDAYERLKRIKNEMSFSEIVIELTKEKSEDSLFKLAGAWSKEDAEKIKKQIYEDRKLPSRRFN